MVARSSTAIVLASWQPTYAFVESDEKVMNSGSIDWASVDLGTSASVNEP